MSAQDRGRWDVTYRGRDQPEPRLPTVFAPEVFPESGTALEVACGQGGAAVWLALRGLDVCAVDVSPIAVDQARQLADRSGVATRCRFEVSDLDDGLPPGPEVDVLLCHRFRDPRLYPAMVRRLAPGGLLALCVLSEVGGEAGAFRAAAGELSTAFAALTPIASAEGDGQAWLLASK